MISTLSIFPEPNLYPWRVLWWTGSIRCLWDVIMRMDSNCSFYQDGLNKTLEAFVRSGKECMATTAVGAFHINRYISLIAANGFSMNYLDRVHLGTLCFRPFLGGTKLRRRGHTANGLPERQNAGLLWIQLERQVCFLNLFRKWGRMENTRINHRTDVITNSLRRSLNLLCLLTRRRPRVRILRRRLRQLLGHQLFQFRLQK